MADKVNKSESVGKLHVTPSAHNLSNCQKCGKPNTLKCAWCVECYEVSNNIHLNL